MNLTGIIAISGRPGLFKVLTQGKNSIIVESLLDKKRFPAYATDRVSALEDISIYTYEEDAPLKDILTAIYKKEDGKECPSHKEDLKVLQNYILEILPNYDQERVYPSDLKKLFQWYNLLLSTGNLLLEEVVEEVIPEKEVAPKAKKETPTEEKKPAAKKAPAKPKAATADKTKSAKPAAAKKVSAVKTGSSRGK
ncbi:MAG: DUF5606 domain-containing protein [Flavobacteriia bacterium]|jgi:hypothetical protein